MSAVEAVAVVVSDGQVRNTIAVSMVQMEETLSLGASSHMVVAEDTALIPTRIMGTVAPLAHRGPLRVVLKI